MRIFLLGDNLLFETIKVRCKKKTHYIITYVFYAMIYCNISKNTLKTLGCL